MARAPFTSTTDTPTLTRRERFAAAATPTRLHLLVLVVGAVAGLLAATRLGLFYDDWAFLVPSLDDPWAPHVGHWSTAPYLLFRGIEAAFGLDSFVPFAIPVLFAHLAAVHLLWRLMGRVGVPPWMATALSVVTTFLGAGSENVLWAFQVGFVGALALMLGAVVLALRPRLTPPVVAAMIVASVLALMSSGTALPMLAVAAAVAWLRHGFPRAAAVFGPVAGIYLVWYLLRGRFAPPAGRAEGLSDLLNGVPTYALTMLSDGFGRAFPVAVLGALFFAGTAVWGVVTWSAATRDARPTYLLFLAAPLFALLTGYSRAQLGLETAVSSRYLYFIIITMLPLIALALSSIVTRSGVRRGGVIALILIWALYNAGGLAASLLERGQSSAQTRERLSAAAALIEAGVDLDPAARPDARWAPDVSVADLEQFLDRGWFTPRPVSETAELTALTTLALDVSPAAPGPADCAVFEPGQSSGALRGAVLIHSEAAATLDVYAVRGDTVGEGRSIEVAAGWTQIELQAGDGVALRVTSATTEVGVCRAG